jgi:hypothetical protein
MSEDGTRISERLQELGLASRLSSGLKSDPWGLWQDIIMAYSKRSLSFSSGELPALSGIASRIQSHTSSNHFAGLWEANLMADMLWFSHNAFLRRDARKSGREYCEAGQLSWPVRLDNRSPSWSWASIGSPIDYRIRRGRDKEFFQRLTELEVINCNVPGLNLYGQAAEGSVKATGPAIKASLVSSDTAYSESYLLVREGETMPEDTWEITVEVGADVCPDTVLEQGEIQWVDGTVEQTIRRSTKSEGSGMTHGPVLCLYLGRMVYSQPGHANWGPDISYALVIGKCDGTANTYSRLGVVELREASGFYRGLSAAIKDHLRKQGHLLRDASTVTVTII